MYGYYNPQVSIDKINNQIAELEKMKQQIPIPTNLTQNFQLTPSRDTLRYASSLEEVQKEVVVGDTPFFSKDMSVLWVKSGKGDIKSYELSEIVVKDEKDMQIEYLQAQINELKKGLKNEQSTSNANDEQISEDTTTND